MNNIEDIKARFKRVKVDIRRIEDKTNDVIDCPVCVDCPFCGGNQCVDGIGWCYNNLAAGIQVFGIGEDLVNLEAFCANAYDDIASLLAMVADLKEEVKRLKQFESMQKQPPTAHQTLRRIVKETLADANDKGHDLNQSTDKVVLSLREMQPELEPFGYHDIWFAVAEAIAEFQLCRPKN